MIRTAVWPLLLAFTANAQEPGDPPPDEAAPQEADPAAEEAVPEEELEEEEPVDPGEEEPPFPEEPAQASASASVSGAAATTPTVSSERNRDIMVVPHRAFLKDGRLELAPSAGVNINDNLISDFAFGGEANYFLSEVFSVGALFQYFPTPAGITDLELDVRRRYLKFPAHNEYVFAGMLNVGYVPIYGKFTVFDSKLIHWEAFLAAGAGIMSTKTIPRSAAADPDTNMNLAFNVAFGGRFFLTRWLSAFFNIRDYLFNDKFEVNEARDTESRFVQNVMLSLGVGIYFPADFKYTTLR